MDTTIRQRRRGARKRAAPRHPGPRQRHPSADGLPARLDDRQDGAVDGAAAGGDEDARPDRRPARDRGDRGARRPHRGTRRSDARHARRRAGCPGAADGTGRGPDHLSAARYLRQQPHPAPRRRRLHPAGDVVGAGRLAARRAGAGGTLGEDRAARRCARIGRRDAGTRGRNRPPAGAGGKANPVQCRRRQHLRRLPQSRGPRRRADRTGRRRPARRSTKGRN